VLAEKGRAEIEGPRVIPAPSPTRSDEESDEDMDEDEDVDGEDGDDDPPPANFVPMTHQALMEAREKADYTGNRGIVEGR
jgi:hypothetical protein